MQRGEQNGQLLLSAFLVCFLHDGHSMILSYNMFYLKSILFLFAFFLSVNLARAENSSIEQELQTISDELHSPFCPGMTLSACPSTSASELKLQIRNWLLEGQSKEDINRRLVNLYGVEILGEQRRKSLNLLRNFVPMLFVFVATFILLFAFGRRLVRRQEKKACSVEQGSIPPTGIPSTGIPPTDSATISAIEEELSRRIRS